MVTVVITAFCSAIAGNVLSARALHEFQRATRDVPAKVAEFSVHLCLSPVIAVQAVIHTRRRMKGFVTGFDGTGGVPQGVFLRPFDVSLFTSFLFLQSYQIRLHVDYTSSCFVCCCCLKPKM